MIKPEQCAWVTKGGFCRWHKEMCCRNTPGACSACVRPISERRRCLNKAYMRSLRVVIKTSHDCFVCNTLNASRYTIYRTCTGKRRYADLYAAKQAAHDMLITKRRVLFAYECPFCGGYHLTHQKRRGLLAMNGVYEEHDVDVETSIFKLLVAG